MNERVLHDILRVIPMIILATLMVVWSGDFGQAVGQPAFAAWGMFAGLSLYGVSLAHVLRRIIFPYIDLKVYARVALLKAEGAGLVFLGVCIVLSAFLMAMTSVVHGAELPPNAVKYLSMLKSEQRVYWPDMPIPSSMGAQVEQETCTKLTSPRCWSPRAELRTARERGVGLGQITKTSRFDALVEVRDTNPAALRGWEWDTEALYDPRFQLRALVLKDLQGWTALKGSSAPLEHLAFSYAAYNGGIGGVLSDRQVCRATAGCDPSKWFGNVEYTSLKAKKPVAGYGKSFFEINREYVHNVLVTRRTRYLQLDTP